MSQASRKRAERNRRRRLNGPKRIRVLTRAQAEARAILCNGLPGCGRPRIVREKDLPKLVEDGLTEVRT